MDSSAQSSSKIAIITGAGSGIGKYVTVALAREGYSVVLSGRRKDALEATALEVQQTNSPSAHRADGRHRSRLRAQALRENKRSLRPPRPAVQQRGHFGRGMPLEDLTYEHWKSVVDTNLTGPFLCTQEAFKIMKSQEPRGGRIINNGSISAHSPAAEFRALYGVKTRSYRPHQSDLARRPQIRHRLRPDRHRKRGHRHGGKDEERRSAGQRHHRSRAHHGPSRCRARRRVYGVPAARRERPVHDRNGDEDAFHRPRLAQRQPSGLLGRRLTGQG